MAQVLTYGIPAAVLALYLQADEGGGIPWWVWVILIIVLLLLLLIAFSRQSEPGEPLPKPEERVTPPVAAPEVEPVEEVVEAVEEPVEESVEEAVEAAPDPDDLKRIEGIGPKISSILNEGGITTFAVLAATDTQRLQELLDEAGIRLAVPDSWPEQASLAAAGKWEELGALQDSLKGGREK
jgi:predicted flap endonuclease-1-like 5' DNA nuclease